jgi:uncharacterized protein YdeI (YjbR/CyaY-like superfamily)
LPPEWALRGHRAQAVGVAPPHSHGGAGVRPPGANAINIARVAVLEREGRMTAAGRAAFARRREERSRTYAYEQSHNASLDAHEVAEFRRHATAWDFFERQAPSYQRRALWFVVSAKRAETRQRRLASLIAASAQGWGL